MEYKWNNEKNTWLIQHRGISFDEIVLFISEGYILDVLENPNFKNQKMYVLDIYGYCWLVPFIKESEYIFLKTAYKSRKMTKNYKRENNGK